MEQFIFIIKNSQSDRAILWRLKYYKLQFSKISCFFSKKSNFKNVHKNQKIRVYSNNNSLLIIIVIIWRFLSAIILLFLFFIYNEFFRIRKLFCSTISRKENPKKFQSFDFNFLIFGILRFYYASPRIVSRTSCRGLRKRAREKSAESW